MEHYYVNDNPQPTGEHEVHTNTCSFFDAIQSKTYLGYFSTCQEAVIEAKKKYTNVDGCYYCCNPCHTR